jgi:uroporphyrinogen-III synthase
MPKITLDSAHILVTRPAHQAENLCRLISDAGGNPVRLPCLAIVPVEHDNAEQERLAGMAHVDWLIFVSANAVTMHQYYLDNAKMPRLRYDKCAAIGAATAEAMRQAGYPVAVVPHQGYDSEALLVRPELQAMAGQNVLIVRGAGGREVLAETLAARGAQVSYMDVYQRAKPITDASSVLNLLKQNQLAAVTITSGEALTNLLALLDGQQGRLLQLPLIVISDRIAHLASAKGFNQITVSDGPSDAAILQALTKSLSGAGRGRID